MSFCTACGTQVDPSSAFCTKCGAQMLPAPPLPGANPGANPAFIPPPPPPSSGGGMLKVVLISLGVVVLLVAVVLAGIGYMAHRFARESKVTKSEDGNTVETPFGRFETSKDPAKILEAIGVDAYPGATPREDGANSMAIGGMEVSNVALETGDSPDQVLEFYKQKYPDAQLVDSGEVKMLHWNDGEKDTITVHIRTEGGQTVVQLSRTKKKD